MSRGVGHAGKFPPCPGALDTLENFRRVRERWTRWKISAVSRGVGHAGKSPPCPGALDMLENFRRVRERWTCWKISAVSRSVRQGRTSARVLNETRVHSLSCCWRLTEEMDTEIRGWPEPSFLIYSAGAGPPCMDTRTDRGTRAAEPQTPHHHSFFLSSASDCPGATGTKHWMRYVLAWAFAHCWAAATKSTSYPPSGESQPSLSSCANSHGRHVVGKRTAGQRLRRPVGVGQDVYRIGVARAFPQRGQQPRPPSASRDKSGSWSSTGLAMPGSKIAAGQESDPSAPWKNAQSR